VVSEGGLAPSSHTVAQLLGHKDLRMAARYQHQHFQEHVSGFDVLRGLVAELSECVFGQSILAVKLLTFAVEQFDRWSR